MSKPPTYHTCSSTTPIIDSPPRHTGLNDTIGVIQSFISIIKPSHYKPTTDIIPLTTKNNKKHLYNCVNVMYKYVDCRENLPEYKCENIREFMIKMKCV